VFLDLVIWEDFLDAMSQTRLQDEYNRAIRDCDLFVMLFSTRVGKYTEENSKRHLDSSRQPIDRSSTRISRMRPSQVCDSPISSAVESADDVSGAIYLVHEDRLHPAQQRLLYVTQRYCLH
jgi:hypothetical protein